MAALPRVGLIVTGGTIDSVGTDRLDLAWYIEAGKRLNDGELLSRIPELKNIAAIQEVSFRRLPSHALVDKDWLELLRTVHAIFDDYRTDGIVITHGTNTLEETAYFLNLTLKTDKPVVVVGSMRPSSAISADGYLNLVNAVKVAADPGSRGRGCLVVMNDTIYNARDVTKNSTYRVDAFQSRDMGPLGFADADGKIIYYRRYPADVRHLLIGPDTIRQYNTQRVTKEKTRESGFGREEWLGGYAPGHRAGRRRDLRRQVRGHRYQRHAPGRQTGD